VAAQAPTSASPAVIAEVREASRRYDDALRRADVAAVGQFFAPEYVFVNARGERLTRADRLANLRTGRTSVDTVAHAPQEEQIRPYGNVVLYSTLLTLGGQYSGRKLPRGRYRALVVWVRRDGRRQQVASQLTQVVAR
jgi:ketosteroid isomerase-like protein